MAIDDIRHLLTPRHAISTDDYTTFFRSLGSRFLIGGDWKAKHTAWGARLTSPKGRNLLNAICSYNCHHFNTGGSTYWPTDLTKLPDLLDFLVARGIPANYIQVEPVFELASDHTPVIVTIGASATNKTATPTFFNFFFIFNLSPCMLIQYTFI